MERGRRGIWSDGLGNKGMAGRNMHPHMTFAGTIPTGRSFENQPMERWKAKRKAIKSLTWIDIK